MEETFLTLLRSPDRFALPVAEFLRQLMREGFPNYPSGQGSAFGDVFILPASFMTQRYRDELNVMKRNASATNYQTMLEEEMNRLAANYLVERRDGVRSFGVVRVFFPNLQPVSISTEAVFFDDQNHRWTPISSVLLTIDELSQNFVQDTGEYFADVSVVAESNGPEYRAAENQVNGFSGINGASRVDNPLPFSDAKADDTNTDVMISIKQSVTNNDLVKSRAIKKDLSSNFQSIRSMQVVGYGHPAMSRDVVEAVVSIQEMLPFSYSEKYNLPLDSYGEVNYFDSSGNIVVAPVGGIVAAISDLTGLDFNALTVTLDGLSSQIVSVQPGFRVRMFTADGVPNDPDEGDYFVTRVEEVPTEPLGTPIKVLRLDRPFKDPDLSNFDPVVDAQKYKYTILGPVQVNHFHVGGKINVYVDSSADTEEVVIVTALSEVVPGSGIGEIPIISEVPTDPITNLPIFESDTGFLLPFLSTVKIEQIAADNELAVERTLIEGEHYVYISAEARSQFTTATNDVIRVLGEDEDGEPLFIGKRLKITYLTNKDIPLMQEYVDDPLERTESTDIKVYSTLKALTDVSLRYKGDVELDTVKTVIDRLILSKKPGGTLTASEIEVTLGLIGVTYVEHPLRITVSYETGTGQLQITSSEDTVTLDDAQSFYPVSALSVEKIG